MNNEPVPLVRGSDTVGMHARAAGGALGLSSTDIVQQHSLGVAVICIVCLFVC